MKRRIPSVRALAVCAAIACVVLPVRGERKPRQPVRSLAGPRATSLRITWLYIEPNTSSQKMTQVQIGREMVVAEKSGSWLSVYANTDVAEQNPNDVPLIGNPDDTHAPISGWVQAKGIVEETMPGGDQILMGAAANEEDLAADPRGPANAARAARLLYQRLYQMFPNSPLAPEAMWRAADIRWQLQKADISTLPSSREMSPDLHEQMDEHDLRKVIKLYPHTRWAALAAFDLIDNKLCGDWQGSAKCPEKESGYYEKYADEYPDGPRTAQALYQAVYRQAVLKDMYAATKDSRKSDEALKHAHELDALLKAHFAGSDYTWRAGALVYKLDEGVPVYGIDPE